MRERDGGLGRDLILGHSSNNVNSESTWRGGKEFFAASEAHQRTNVKGQSIKKINIIYKEY